MRYIRTRVKDISCSKILSFYSEILPKLKVYRSFFKIGKKEGDKFITVRTIKILDILSVLR